MNKILNKYDCVNCIRSNMGNTENCANCDRLTKEKKSEIENCNIKDLIDDNANANKELSAECYVVEQDSGENNFDGLNDRNNREDENRVECISGGAVVEKKQNHNIVETKEEKGNDLNNQAVEYNSDNINKENQSLELVDNIDNGNGLNNQATVVEKKQNHNIVETKEEKGNGLNNQAVEYNSDNINKENQSLELVDNIDNGNDIKNLSKFKNIEALESAYVNLEKEFTKKCQKIKELEKGYIDNVLAPTISKKEAVSQVIAQLGEKFSVAKYFAEDIAKMADVEDLMQDNKAEEVLLNIMSEKYLPNEKLSENEEFLNNYIYGNENIKRVIVDNYLEEIDGRKIPKRIGGGKIVVTPSAKPKTIAEAGAITLNIIKNRRNN